MTFGNCPKFTAKVGTAIFMLPRKAFNLYYHIKKERKRDISVTQRDVFVLLLFYAHRHHSVARETDKSRCSRERDRTNMSMYVPARKRERERDGENGYKSKSDVSILNVDSAVTTKAGGHAATMPPCK
jgi:hypothetical protein